MCGFAGVVAFNGAPAPITPLTTSTGELLQHRGPDGTYYLHQQHFSVVHTRLAIIDPDPRANQPMQSACGRYTLVYNGEIYNYRALRAELTRSGHVFLTDSDTEVLLHFLIEHGALALHRLNGCFAFAFIDSTAETVLLARDRMGINPLWYNVEKGQLSFASELTALPLPEKRSLNSSVLRAYLEFSYNPSNASIVEGVHRLPPGCSLTFPSENQPAKWFSVAQSYTRSERTYACLPNLRSAMEEAVGARLIADVPVGSFLSGGIDSSIVAALAKQQKTDLNTFSVGFSDQPQFDERKAAEFVAKHIGSHHHTFDCTAEQLSEHAFHFLDAVDEPFADSSGLAMSFLASQTKHHVKVALSGDGADELFGGYRKHRAHALAAGSGLTKISKLLQGAGKLFSAHSKAKALLKFTEALSLSPADRYFYWARFNHSSAVDRVFQTDPSVLQYHSAITEVFETFNELDAALLADQIMVLPNDMLTKVDLMSMRYGLEVRVPFLDPAVVSIANALPAELKYNRKVGKIPLRMAFSDLLPESTFARSKKGFEIPLHWLLSKPLASAVEALKNNHLLHEANLDTGGVTALVNEFQRGNQQHTPLVWSLLVLHHWLQRNQSNLRMNS